MSSNTLVSARVAPAKKDAAKKALDSLGATVSDLVNQAFDYVIENKALPGLEEDVRPTDEEIDDFILQSTVDIDWDGISPDYRSIIREGKRERYESLA